MKKYNSKAYALLALIPLAPFAPYTYVICITSIGHLDLSSKAMFLSAGGALLYSLYILLLLIKNKIFHTTTWITTAAWNIYITASGQIPIWHDDLGESIFGILAIWMTILSFIYLFRHVFFAKKSVNLRRPA